MSFHIYAPSIKKSKCVDNGQNMPSGALGRKEGEHRLSGALGAGGGMSYASRDCIMMHTHCVYLTGKGNGKLNLRSLQNMEPMLLLEHIYLSIRIEIAFTEKLKCY